MINNKITFAYQKRKIFDCFEINIKQNEITAICGHNGAGKTTLLKILAGLLPLAKGDSIPIFERRWFFPDSGGLIGSFSLKEHIEIITMLYHEHLNFGYIEELKELLEVYSFINTPVERLSTGQYAKAHFITMLSASPKFFFLDESFASLDPKAVKQLTTKLKELTTATIVFTSHDLSLVSNFASRCVIIREGKITWDSDTSSVQNRKDALSLDILQSSYEVFA